MSLILFTDNASSLLASGILSTDTTLTVTATQGALFPAPGAGQISKITLEDTSGNIEITHCTGRTGDTMTIVRAQEGTSALGFASGSRVELRCTAGTLQAMLQKNGGDTLTNTTNLGGVLALGSGGSIQGGEYAGGFLRSAAGVTAGQIFVSGGQPMSGTATILTSSNAQSSLSSGQSLCLTGMILFWSGSLGAIPSGWHICDGTAGTPDLRDQFIVGGDGALPTSGTYNANTGNTAATGTIAINALALNMLPSHVHPFDYFFGNSTAVVGIPGFSAPTAYLFAGSSGGTRIAFAGSPNTGNGTAPPTGTFTDSTGHVHAQSIPYRAVFAIMKT
jgi:hypothetical protein